MEEQRREYMEKKLREAEEKRQRQLNLKIMKAHEEETKVSVNMKICLRSMGSILENRY